MPTLRHKIFQPPQFDNLHSLLINEDRLDFNDDGKHTLNTWDGSGTDKTDLGAISLLANAVTVNIWMKPTGPNINKYPNANDPDRSIWELKNAVDNKIMWRMDIRWDEITEQQQRGCVLVLRKQASDGGGTFKQY